MKHKIRLASLLFIFSSSLLVLSSCNNDKPTTSISTSEKITGVLISGPKSVEVGEEIHLFCDVQGTEDDSCTWESLNSDIASISDKGDVKGLKPGIATIKATSKKDPSFSATCEVEVKYKKATSVNLKVLGDDSIQYDNTKKSWTIPLGKTCIIDYETPAGTREPDSISFDIQLEEGETLVANSFKIETIQDENGRTVGKVSTLGVVSNVIVRFRGYYTGDAPNDPSLKASVVFEVVDVNLALKEKLQGYVDALKTKEQDSFASGTYKVTRTEGETTTLEDTLTLKSFTTATYGTRTIKTTSTTTEEKTINYFNGIDESHNKYFHFSYDNDGYVQNIFANETSNDTNKKQAQMPYTLKNDLPVYGLSTIISNYFTSDFSDGLHNFANIYCYANAKFEFSTDSIKVSSTYTDDNNQNFQTTLNISLSNDSINAFALEVKTTENDKQVVYKEEVTDLTFKERTIDTATDNPLHLDLNKYYIKSFKLYEIAGQADPEGRWNYSDTSRYGSQSTTQVGSNMKYVLSANKTLVFGVKDLSPTTANVIMDTITAQSASPTIIPHPTMTGDGIFSISPAQGQDGKFATGESTITFTSMGGGSVTIVVEFTEIKLTGIKVDDKITNNTFPEIRVGDMTDAFTLNPIPDDLAWNFDIEITQGTANGISLYAWQNGNWQQNPHGSFSIEGVVAGEYKFRFVIKEQPEVKSTNEYTIKINDALNDSDIKKEIIHRYFEKRDSMMGTVKGVFFDSETQFTYFEEGFNREGRRMEQKINYEIKNGQVRVTSEQSLNTGFLYQKIKGERIMFNDGFSRLTLIVAKVDVYEAIEQLELERTSVTVQ